MSPPPSPIDLGHLRWLPPPSLGHTMRPSALFLIHQVDLELLASPMRSGVDLCSGSHRFLSPSSSLPAGSPLCASYACLWWSRCVCITGGSTECGAPGGAVVKTPSGSLWPAVRALPRHAVQTCAWAYGELVLFLLYPSPLFSGHGLWPFGHNQWAKLTGIALCCC
jgi:hypothetical protein